MTLSPTADGLASFRIHRVVEADNLVCPVWPMYLAYRRYAERHGFEVASGKQFMDWLSFHLQVVVKQRECGGRRAVVFGVGVTASDPSEAQHSALPVGEKTSRVS